MDAAHLTVEEAADLLNVDRLTVVHWVRTRRLVRAGLRGRAAVFRPEDLFAVERDTREMRERAQRRPGAGNSAYSVKHAGGAMPCAGTTSAGRDCPRVADQESPVPLCSKHLSAVYLHVQDRFDLDQAVMVAADAPLPTPDSMPQPEFVEQYVYFARFGDRIKIGTTANVTQRMAALHTIPLAVIKGGRPEERQLHDQFARHRLVGEWFDAHPDLIEYIRHLHASGIAMVPEDPSWAEPLSRSTVTSNVRTRT